MWALQVPLLIQVRFIIRKAVHVFDFARNWHLPDRLTIYLKDRDDGVTSRNLGKYDRISLQTWRDPSNFNGLLCL